ncbi:nicotinate-nucleotide--dimethylbenzimidazole phosphoribosyltransferase [Desulfovibrio sp. OttesenSCG-928-I05]|nr:nicotinate-nucleotide--dimethylbenzimidazole phosphoribosyltransferase [Desulfovibrio sp. OttesenSCG-928-I05]
MQDRLDAACRAITPLDQTVLDAAWDHINQLTKPLGSLGKLEEIAARLAAIQGGASPIEAYPARFFTIAGDHGVVAEGINSTPQIVTRQQIHNFLNGGGGINALCTAAGAELFIVDAGVKGEEFAPHPMLIRARVAEGTANLAVEPAMTQEQCLAALTLGMDLAEDAVKAGCRTLGAGEMGIGNTTPSAALFCAFLGADPAEMTGPGAGVPPIGLEGKTRVIKKALATHAETIASGDPLAILAALGGLEIAAMAGVFLGGAAAKRAVIIDGFIATAAFAAARAFAPHVADYCFFAHRSGENGHTKALELLGQDPYLNFGFRLGEGTGAALFMPLLRSAASVYNTMGTFASAGVVL